MSVIINQGLRLTVAPASDTDKYKAVGETFDAMACPVTDMLLRRLGGRAYTIGDSWACRFTFCYVDADGDTQPVDLDLVLGSLRVRWDVWDPITDSLVFSRTQVVIPDHPSGWYQLEIEDASAGTIRVRIWRDESLLTEGGMYQHTFTLEDVGNDVIQTFGGGPVEILPERPTS